MIRTVRIIGALLMIVGALVILTWLIKPLRQIWPYLFEWFRSLPGAIQLGLVLAAVGFLILFSSLIVERLEDRKKEGILLDDYDD
jgi:hypothetical protein